MPLGWSATGAEVDDPATGERGALHLRPFELKLISREHIHTTSRVLAAPMNGPPGPTNPPGGPGAPPGGPPGGYAPPQPCRAILKEADGKLTWIVEQHEAPIGEHGRWALLLTEPIE